MFEIILIVWVGVYALWVLNLFAMGEMRHLKSVTISYVSLPFLTAFAIAAFSIGIAIAPIISIFSSSAREAARKVLNERM